MQRILLALVVVAGSFPVSLSAGFVKEWHLADVERAPVLIVGRVETVRKEFQVPRDTMVGNAEIWAMASQVEVIRSYSSSDEAVLAPNSTITVRFLTYRPGLTMSVNGTPPPLASLRAGVVLLIPLQRNESPTRDPWMLLGDEGVGLTVPVRPVLDEAHTQPHTGREFILREITNSLSHGTAAEMSTAAGYVHDQYQNLASEVMPVLRKAIGADEPRWANVLVDLMGTQRPSLNDLRVGHWRDINWNPSTDHGFSIASAILNQLPDTPATGRLITDALIARMSFAPECASFLARDYADDYFVASLKSSLEKRQPGSLYVASSLVNSGYKSFQPYALAAARQIAVKSTANPTYAELGDRKVAESLLHQ
ncbi:MAG TPA: hypothetical protein VGK64_21385 [Bryobacteraceae bacterium]